MVRLKAPPRGLGDLHDGTPALRRVEDFLSRLSRHAEVKSAVAIGSRARGDWRPWSDVDLVVQYLSPRRVSNLIQRVGRSGHRIGEVSRGVVLAASPDDLLSILEAAF